MPRKSSTNTRALSTRIQHLEQNERQTCTYSPLRGQPSPVSNSTKTIKRRVYVEGTNLTIGAVSTALSGLPGDWSVNYIECYGTTASLGSSFPKGTWILQQDKLLTDITNNTLPVINVTDYGTATYMAGVLFKVPKTRAKLIYLDTSSTTNLVSSTTTTTYVLSINQQLQL